ncbi:hypothetical protein [Paraburkholderia kirstenboschensis]|uniref:Uncharacterized protein n=1 Tax=Paraburkholderia kirstenboschensis TaxID=1245436 RepID=A0ABZ0ETB7_9BURK|nr:hypothetical protein [Paraburkholderia kirstenboschensis]WOD19492.1 hypothetical protein RW095_24980 [Paraburkholderia kirstenboschensis]
MGSEASDAGATLVYQQSKFRLYIHASNLGDDMNNNEFAKLFRLTSPYFPRLREVFVAVSAGEDRDRGFLMYFAEFFIFSTNGISASIGQRTYVQQHGSGGGASLLFKLAKTRAIAELAEKTVELLGSKSAPDGLHRCPQW